MDAILNSRTPVLQSALEVQAQTFSSKMQSLGGKLSTIGGGMTAGLTAPIVGGMNEAANMASDLSETVSKTNAVFGKSTDQVMKFADGAATALGQSKQQALDAASSMGNLFVSMGMTSDKSADMSIGMTKLASDLASFNNMPVTEVLDKLRSGLTGETTPLKSLGVNINAAAIQAQAMSMGLVKADVDMVKVNGSTLKLTQAQATLAKVTSMYGADSMQASMAQQKVAEAQQSLEQAMAGSNTELTAAQKAQATYALIMGQTQTAQGDFARTSDGLANSQRIESALFQDTAAKIGENVLPIKLKLVETVNKLIEAFQNLSPDTQKTIVVILGVVAAIGPLLLIAGQLVGAIGTLAPVFAALGTTIGGPVIAAIAAAIAIGYLIYKAWTENWGGIQEKVGEALGYIKSIVYGVIGGVQSFIERHSAEIQLAMTLAWSIIQAVVTGIIVPLADRIISLFRDVAIFIAEHRTQITSTLEGAWNVIYGTIQTTLALIGGIVKTAISLLKGDWQGAWDSVKEMTKGALDGIERILGGLYQIGSNMIQGLINGAKSMADRLTGALSEIIQNAIKSAKDWLGIHSPSTVFYGFGYNMMQGLANGIEHYGALPQVELGASMGQLTSTGQQAAQSVRSNASGQRAGNTAYVNVTVNGNDSSAAEKGVVQGLRRAGFVVAMA